MFHSPDCEEAKDKENSNYGREKEGQKNGGQNR